MENYARFFDAVTGDALYLEGPLFNLLTRHGKHALAVLKGNHSALLADASAVLPGEPPQSWSIPNGVGTVQCWEADQFHADSIQVPLRVVHTEETVHSRQRIAGKWEENTQIHYWWWSTTIGADLMPARNLEGRPSALGFENKLFNTLSMYWALDHCFCHLPQAILNFILTLLIAFELLHCFVLLHLKSDS